ncbi:MAG: DUF2442 domain-containing protein [Anaerolineae bacterium]|nr:DUF2442 domain-containing protein [Anaerolineae bacterium]
MIWILGTILIVLSWFHVVSLGVGWFGFFLALIATLVSVIVNANFRRRRPQKRVAAAPAVAAAAEPVRPVDVTFAGDLLQVSLSDGRVISAPLAWYPQLEEASEETRTDYELDSNGIYWPDLDVDVSLLDILDGTPPDAD